MTEAQVKLIEELKAFCGEPANYENGYDVPVECWGASEWAEWITDFPEVVDVATFKVSYQFMIDRADEIRSTAF